MKKLTAQAVQCLLRSHAVRRNAEL